MTDAIASRDLVAELLHAHFGETLADLDPSTKICTLGDEDAVDEFFDALTDRLDTFGLHGDERSERAGTVGKAIAFAEAVRREKLGENWQAALTPLQRGIFKVSPLVGVAMFFIGVQLKVRNLPMAEPLMGLGMFVAAEMFWGVKGMFEWVAKKEPALIETHGHAKLFWLVLVAAYGVSFIGLGLVFAIFGV